MVHIALYLQSLTLPTLGRHAAGTGSSVHGCKASCSCPTGPSAPMPHACASWLLHLLFAQHLQLPHQPRPCCGAAHELLLPQVLRCPAVQQRAHWTAAGRSPLPLQPLPGVWRHVMTCQGAAPQLLVPQVQQWPAVQPWVWWVAAGRSPVHLQPLPAVKQRALIQLAAALHTCVAVHIQAPQRAAQTCPHNLAMC